MNSWNSFLGWPKLAERLVPMKKSGRLSPVILLQGREGLGKKNFSLGIAAQRLCDTHSACGTCTPCQEVMRLSHPDLLVLGQDDSEKSIRVQDAAQLQKHLSTLSPSGTRAVIIWDSERLTLEAVNRLLKIFEEPPEQAFLVLTTSRPRLLPATLLSRCFNLQLGPVSLEELCTWAEKLSQQHGRSIADLPTFCRERGLSPGKIHRSISGGDEHLHHLEDLVHKLLSGKNTAEVLSSAATLAKDGNTSLNLLLTLSEWELQKRYRQSLCLHLEPTHVRSSILEDPVRLRERRQVLSQLRKYGIQKKIALNVQLAAESLGFS